MRNSKVAIIEITVNNFNFEQFVKEYDPNLICLEVRTPDEFILGPLRNAQNLSYLSNDLIELFGSSL